MKRNEDNHHNDHEHSYTRPRPQSLPRTRRSLKTLDMLRLKDCNTVDDCIKQSKVPEFYSIYNPAYWSYEGVFSNPKFSLIRTPVSLPSF